PAALQVGGPLRNDLEDALILGGIVDRWKRAGTARDAQIAEQAVRTEARQPHAEQPSERSAPEREQLHLGTRGIASKRAERLVPELANRGRSRLDHWLTSRPSRWRAKKPSTTALCLARPASWPWPS